MFGMGRERKMGGRETEVQMLISCSRAFCKHIRD
jgi:hypothetical protein